MKHLLSSALLLAAGLSLTAPAALAGGGASPAKAKPTPYTVDAKASKLEWQAEKVTGKHNGTLALQNGTLEVSGDQLTGGTFTVDMTSLKVLDVQNEGMNAKLTGHLKSDDFFSVEKNPTATFTITSVAPIKGAAAGQPNYTVNGDLTIKGMSKPLAFPATVSVKDGQATATGTAKVDRTLYDIRFRSAKFFSDLGDKMINDDFTVTFNVVARK